MRLSTKTTLFSTGIALVMILVLTAVSLVSFRQFSILSAKAHTRTAAEIVRVYLTEAMVNGVIDKRENFLIRLQDVEGLQSAKVVRGPKVIQQFGEGLAGEQATDSIEEQVLNSGEPYYELLGDNENPYFRSTIPFVADTRGNPNCLNCHQVKEGTVLGAVTLTMSISHLKESALMTIGAMVLAIGFFSVLIVLFFRRLTRPLSQTAEDVQLAMKQALEGRFDSRIQSHTNDEVGQIAEDINQLTGYLQSGLSRIRDDVAQLIQTKLDSEGKGNLLTETTDMVDGLIRASQFKQAIEEDETKLEVYCRIARVIREDFDIPRFSLYEVANSKNRMLPVVVDGETDPEIRWCDPQIMVRSESCRARRTGHTIDSSETPFICNSFKPPQENPELCHICVPVIQSGTVGSVVQMVVNDEEAVMIHAALPLISVYMREAAPVIEAKRLMDTLRESNLRDAMTGLHNRRFLEEYVDTLIAQSQRRETQLSILMLDLDYFKQVNDTYGHDAGDSVLKALSKVLKQSVRSSDMVIRYGGEEFLIILQETEGNYADEVAEKIRAAVEDLKVELPGVVLQKTISIGVADYPTDSETFWQAVKYADVALYKAKEQGRNRVVHFRKEMWADNEQY